MVYPDNIIVTAYDGQRCAREVMLKLPLLYVTECYSCLIEFGFAGAILFLFRSIAVISLLLCEAELHTVDMRVVVGIKTYIVDTTICVNPAEFLTFIFLPILKKCSPV